MNRSQIISIHGASGSRGFTMIEAIVAFVVLAAGLLALLSFHSVTQKTNADAKIQAEAVAFAEEKLQELESFLAEDDARLAEGEGSDSPAGQLATFARAWEVSEDDDLANLIFAEVTVTWTDREGEEQQVVLNSAIDRKAPAESVANFLKVVANAQGGGGGGGSTWGDPPGGQDPVDPEDPVDPSDPENPSSPPVSEPQATYTLEISGTTQTNLGDVELSNAAELIQVASDPALLASSANCNIPNNNKKSFSCIVTYFNTSVGWSGTITLSATPSNKKIKGNSPYTTTCANTINLVFSGVKQNTQVTMSDCV